MEHTAAHLPGGFYVQLGPWRDPHRLREFIARAEAAGARAFVLTLDSAVAGPRYHQRRYLHELPSTVTRANFTSTATMRELAPDVIDPATTWETIAQLVESTRLPVLGKGIMRSADAARAVQAGLAGVIVSNHGGRNLDAAIPTLDVLPEVVAAVAGAVPVLVEGGVRRGTDVLVALAQGAAAVLVGRPYLWGLAADGAAGVQAVVETMVDELRTAMALCGVTSARAVPVDVVRRLC
jgi:4-hydroxymandelate oxidase